LKQWWPVIDVGTQISLVQLAHKSRIVVLNATVSANPNLADGDRRIEVINDDREFTASFRCSDKR
jgi:hypothetical protein